MLTVFRTFFILHCVRDNDAAGSKNKRAVHIMLASVSLDLLRSPTYHFVLQLHFRIFLCLFQDTVEEQVQLVHFIRILLELGHSAVEVLATALNIQIHFDAHCASSLLIFDALPPRATISLGMHLLPSPPQHLLPTTRDAMRRVRTHHNFSHDNRLP